jgi:hypothetical protein
MSVLFVGQAAARLGISPDRLANALYRGVVDRSRFPVVCGRRVINEKDLPAIERALRERGLLDDRRRVRTRRKAGLASR